MIVQTHFDVNGRDFVRTTSDSGCYVVRDGVSYSEACDPAELGRTYTEGDLKPPEEQDTEELTDKAAAYDILVGGGAT